MTLAKKPWPVCGAAIEGPSVGRHVVAWRKRCKRRVKTDGDRCYQHPPRTRIH